LLLGSQSHFVKHGRMPRSWHGATVMASRHEWPSRVYVCTGLGVQRAKQWHSTSITPHPPPHPHLEDCRQAPTAVPGRGGLVGCAHVRSTAEGLSGIGIKGPKKQC
jgi:hypothetical protein